MFHGVGLYIFDRLITSLSCHTSVYVMHLSKKDLRSWLKGSLSWSKSECETVRPCIWCTSCLTTVSHLSQESLMLWLEANVSAYHQRIMIQNLLEHCWTEGLSFWKAIRPQVFSCVFFAQLPCDTLCFLTALKRHWVHHVITCKHNGNVIGAYRKLSVESCTYFDLFYWKLARPQKDRKGVPTHTEAIAWSSPS